MNNKMGIVLVNYNGLKFQNDCVKTILSSSFKDFYLIIVDNNSTDGSMEALSEFSDDRIIKIYNEDNLGITGGNNIGINKSIELGCYSTLLLNNDTELENNTLEVLNDKLSICDVVSPKILYYDNHNIWYFGGDFDMKRAVTRHFNMNLEDVETKDDIICDYAPTCCLLIKNSVFSDIGIIDDDYFIYCDDADFCFRLKINNIRILVTPSTIIYHKVSSSTGGDESPVFQYYGNRNRIMFAKKFKKYFPFYTYKYVLWTRIIKSIIGNNKNKKYIKAAVKDYKKGLKGKTDLSKII